MQVLIINIYSLCGFCFFFSYIFQNEVVSQLRKLNKVMLEGQLHNTKKIYNTYDDLSHCVDGRMQVVGVSAAFALQFVMSAYGKNIDTNI